MKRQDKLRIIKQKLDEFEGSPEWGTIAEAIGYTTDTHTNPAEAARSFWRANSKERDKIFTKYQGSNQLDIISDHDQITNIDELFAYCDIDPEEWVVLRKEITKSTKSVAKDVEKDLEWDEDGVMHGYNRRGSTQLVPVVRIKVTLIKKNPDALEPIVQPIQVVGKIKEPKPRQVEQKIQRWLIGGDEQIGFERRDGKIFTYHDRRAMDIFAQVAKDWSWDGIILLGDLLDWTEFSRYTTTPNQYGFTQSSICEGHYHLKRLRLGSPDTPIEWILGNHGKRPIDAVENNVKGLWDVKLPEEVKLNLPPIYHPARLLDASALHVGWSENYPDGEVWISPDLRAIHGESYKDGATNTMTKNISVSVIQGHGHGAEVKFRTRHTSEGPKYVMALINGCLCKIEGIPGRKKRNNWQQTFSVVELYPGAPVPSVTIVPIIDGRASFGGMMYEGQDYRESLIEDTGWDIF